MPHADELLSPEKLAPLIKRTIFSQRIYHYLETGSTNELAMAAATQGESEGAVFLAEEQLAGRGRGDHSWHSPPSVGIYCSVVLRPQRVIHKSAGSGSLAPLDALLLSLSAGLAAQAATERVTAVRPELRWPNDLFLSGRKFCGILAELSAEADRVRFAVVGIGMNVNQQNFPPELEAIATSLRRETGRSWLRLELTAALLESLDREYRILRSGRREDILRRFEENCSFTRGKRVRVEENVGYEGVTEGLDERGFLRVRTKEGLRTVLSGGVRALV